MNTDNSMIIGNYHKVTNLIFNIVSPRYLGEGGFFHFLLNLIAQNIKKGTLEDKIDFLK